MKEYHYEKNFIINIYKETQKLMSVNAVKGTQKRQISRSLAMDLVSLATSEKYKWKSRVIRKLFLFLKLCLDLGTPQGWHTGSWLYCPYSVDLTWKATDNAEELLINGSRIQATAASPRPRVILSGCLHFSGLLALHRQTILFASPPFQAGVRIKQEHANEGTL